MNITSVGANTVPAREAQNRKRKRGQNSSPEPLEVQNRKRPRTMRRKESHPPPSDELLDIIEIVFREYGSVFSLPDRMNASNVFRGFYHRVVQPRGPKLGLPACAVHMAYMQLLGKSATQEEQEDASQWQGTRSPVDDTPQRPGNFMCCNSHSDASIWKTCLEMASVRKNPEELDFLERYTEKELELSMLITLMSSLGDMHHLEIKAVIEDTERPQYPEVAVAHWIQAIIRHEEMMLGTALLRSLQPLLCWLIARTLAFEDERLRTFIFEDIRRFAGRLNKKAKLTLYITSLEYWIFLCKDTPTLTETISYFPKLIGLQEDTDLALLGVVINSIDVKQLRNRTKPLPLTLWCYLDPECVIQRTLGAVCAKLCESCDTQPPHLSPQLQLYLRFPGPLAAAYCLLVNWKEALCLKEKFIHLLSQRQCDELLHAFYKMITQNQTEEGDLFCILFRGQIFSLFHEFQGYSENLQQTHKWYLEIVKQLPIFNPQYTSRHHTLILNST